MDEVLIIDLYNVNRCSEAAYVQQTYQAFIQVIDVIQERESWVDCVYFMLFH